MHGRLQELAAETGNNKGTCHQLRFSRKYPGLLLFAHDAFVHDRKVGDIRHASGHTCLLAYTSTRASLSSSSDRMA